MLTNLFYYNYYKPYLLSGSKSEKTDSSLPRRKQAIKESLSYNKELYKNVALKNDVVSYARGVSKSIVSLKDAAYVLDKNTDSIKMAAYAEGMQNAVDWVDEDITGFVESYNNARSFARSQIHSRSITNLSDDMANDVDDYARLLNRAGVTVTDEGVLEFDVTKIEGYSYNKLSKALDGVKEFAQVIYDKTTDFLKRPLSEHMNFRSLNYYYNYKLGTVTHNPFQLVESGMLVDRTV